MNEDALLADALIDPSVVNNISHLVVLHPVQSPNVREVAILLHHIVCFVIFAYDFASMLDDSPTDSFHKVCCFTCLRK